MKKNILANIRVLAIMMACLTVGVSNVWGDETLTITGSIIGGSSGYSTSSTTATTDNDSDVDVEWTDALENSSPLQLKASTGVFLSTSCPSGLKIKTITITGVTNTMNLYCSSNGSSWSSALSYTAGTALNVSSSNYKYFKVTASSSYTKANSITIVYTTTVAQTVTFNKQGGTFDDESVFTRTTPSYQIDEASAGAGVTLPAVSPSSACASEGWGFYGWATAAVGSSTTTAPTIVGKAGDTYYPSTDITLHAVYAKGEYTKETSAITAGGKYLIVANSGGSNYIMTNTYSTYEVEDDEYGQLAGKQIDETNTTNHTYSAVDISPNYVFTIVTASSVEVNTGDWMIENVVDENYLSVDYEAIYLSYASMSSGRDGNTITLGEGGTWQIENAYNSGANKLYYNASENQFQSYSTASKLLLYKETITPTYYSNPACCEDDPTIGGTAQLKTSGTFSLSQVDVECTSATVQSNCEWTDYGFIWSESVNTTATLQLNSDGSAPSGVTKVQVGTSGDASSFKGSLEKSSFETGHTYYYRAYVKNCYYDGSYVYSNTSTLASFTPYTISYNNNGESGTIDTKVVNTGGSVTLSDGTGFTKDHYHIDHWALNSASGTSYDLEDTYSSITANATFYAIWAINTNIFVWDFNDGTSSETEGEDYTEESLEMEYGATIIYPSSSSMSKTGYTFTGWSTTTTTMPDEALEISANWSAVNYDVTYHLNGGTGASDRTYTIETATFSLATPTRTGYQFDGWYANSDLSTGGVQTQITVGSTGDKEYWAKWTPNTYKVQFYANGGTGSMSDQNFTYDAPKKALSANTFTPATGKYFAGWSTTSSGDVEYTDKQSVNNLTTTNSATVKLYAVWADHTYTNYRTNCVTRYDITLDDGEVATTYNGSAKVTENGTTLVKLVAPTKTGYTLTGYYTAKSDGDLIADTDGNLKKSVTVSATAWTDENGKWVLGDDATFYAHWSAKTYTITLNQNGATTDGTTSVDATYDSKILSASISNPTKTGYDFGGWYSGVGGTGELVINSSGTLQNSVTIETIGWTDASGNWTLDGTATLYAKWTAKTTTVSFDQNNGTGGQTSDKTATYDAAMPTPITVPTRSGYYFGGYYDGSGGTGTQYYTASGASAKNWDKDGNTKLYARWYGDLKAWCDPAITVTGDVHLTSFKNYAVYATSTTNNLLNVSTDDLGSATSMEIAYLNADADDAEVAKASSLFRMCNDGTSDYNAVDASSSSVDISEEARNMNKNYSVSYTPNGDEQLDNYKIQLTFKGGDKVLKTVTKAIHGRSLPEEFVLAIKSNKDSKWYALPNTILDNSSAISPTAIYVDNTTTPTKAMIAATSTVYKAAGRYSNGANVYGIRLTDGVLRETKYAHLKVSSSSGTNYVWTSTTGSSTCQDLYLQSSDFGAYTITVPTSGAGDKKFGINNLGNIGYFASNAPNLASEVYLLPIDAKCNKVEAAVSEWSRHDILLEADLSSVSAETVKGELDEVVTSALTIDDAVAEDTYLIKLGDDIDFNDKEDELLLLKWYDSSDELVGASLVTVPSIIAAGDKDEWSDFASDPTINDIVVLSKPMAVDIDGTAKARRIVIDKSGSNTGKLTVNAGEGLVIAETIKKYNGTGFVATEEEDIKLLSDGTNGTGALAVGEESIDTKATVQFYTKANANDGWVNQYFGIPVEETSGLAYYGAYLYEFDAEAFRWNNITSEKLQAFHPYRILRREKTTTTFEIGGTLVLPGTTTHKDKVLDLFRDEADYKETDPSTDEPYNTINIYSNSWAAPIAITAFEDGDFVNVEKTIYIFNAGTVAQAEAQSSFGAKDDTPGQWLSLPISTVKENPSTYLTVIPSQQAFLVYATGAPDEEDGHHLKLDYKKLVYDPAVAGTAAIVPNRAPRREAEEEMEMMCLKVEGESGYRDRVMIHMRSDFSQGFDNGWDGSKIEGNATAPQMYAITEGGYMSVNCVPTAEGTVIAFKTGSEDSNYNFTFDYDGEEVWYLNDLQEQESTMIDAAHSYQFSSTTSDDKARFVISKSPIHKVTTGVEGTGNDPEVHKLLIEDKLFIIRGGLMYSADGALVK